MQPDYGGMQQYVQWRNASGNVQQFYTDTSIQVMSHMSICIMPQKLCIQDLRLLC